jgi:predicted O-methyltransferase YrrM
MREYLYELTHSEDFETVILPVGDGVAVSINKEKYFEKA